MTAQLAGQGPKALNGVAAGLVDLGLSFRDIINAGGPQLEETLLPGLLPVLPEVEHSLQVGNDNGSPAEILLSGDGGVRKRDFREKFKGFCLCYLYQDFFVFVFDGLESFLVLLPQIKVL